MFGTRCGTSTHPDQKDKRISINLSTIERCKEFIDRWIEKHE